MTPIKRYLNAKVRYRSLVEPLRKELNNLEYEADCFNDFSGLTLEPAGPTDIVEGKILYYPDEDEPFWKIVDEVLKPHSDWKAYCAQDGCRYGLDGAYVEVENDEQG